ncbi:MAG: acylneuraminate cytidylyltransferase family protein [Elusimicrobia bacterium]|nr:acylneuraminate cytidylyltransferase family protein [Elusimicrobiota bacterium]
MYKNVNVVCIIPARGGSKGVPKKNIKDLLGKPLIAYSIDQAKQSKYIDRVLISTDNEEIAAVARKYNAELPFIRPHDLATDTIGVIEVLYHAIDWLENKDNYSFEILVMLHTTTPLRTIEDIDNSIELLFSTGADNIVSVTEAYRNPYFNMVELAVDSKAKLVKEGNFVTRQSAPPVYDMNASIYVWRKEKLKQNKKVLGANTYAYVMPKERSVDIDYPLDFKIVEMLLREKLNAS